MIGKTAKGAWWGANLLLCVALWLISTGRVYFDGLPASVLDGLVGAKNLIPADNVDILYSLLASTPKDITFSASLLQAVCLLAAMLVAWLSLAKVWANPVSPTLTTGLLFFGGSTLWLSAETPGQAVAVLFKAVAVACIVAGKVPLLCGAVLAVGYADPPLGIALYLSLVYLAFHRSQSYGNLVTSASIVGTGALLAVMIGDFTLRPSLQGLSVWCLWPLLGLAFSRELRDARKGLYLTLLGASALTGSAELASALCLGDLALIGLRSSKSQAEPTSPQHGVRVSVPVMVQLLALAVLMAAVLPGEQYLNRRILIPSQEKRIPLTQLLIPFSLEHHAERLAHESWRRESPYPEMRPKELTLLKQLQAPFRVITLDATSENRQLSLLYALLSQQELKGWATPRHLSTSSLVCREVRKNVLVGPQKILFRFDSSSAAKTEDLPRLESGPTLPTDLQGLPTLVLKNLWNLPFRVQSVSDKPGTGYELKTSSAIETLFFPTEPAKLVLSAAPMDYHISSLTNPEIKRELSVTALNLTLTAPNLDEVLPSRTLVPLTFKISNLGEMPISTREIQSVTLTVKDGASSQPYEQQFPEEFVLFPKEGLSLPLYLATPANEGLFQIEASFQTLDGEMRPLPILGDTSFRTGSRLEEPKTP
jgi:hypothetical protein